MIFPFIQESDGIALGLSERKISCQENNNVREILSQILGQYIFYVFNIRRDFPAILRFVLFTNTKVQIYSYLFKKMLTLKEP
jgi:hypothetical protein